MSDIVDIVVQGRSIGFWSQADILMSIDNQSSVGFSAPFEPERKDFREMFRPFSFAPVQVFVDKTEKIFTGTMLDVTPQVTAGERVVNVSAYATPAKLAACDMPYDAIPFECNNLKLDEIAKHFCDPFDISVVFDGDPGPAFLRAKTTKRMKHRNRVYGGAGQETLIINGNVMEFLADLARQRGFVISSDENGALLFQRSTSSSELVATFRDDQQPIIVSMPQFNPQEVYSEITAVISAKKHRKGGVFTVRNPFMTDRRSMSFNLDDTEAADAETAALAKIARMFANMMSISIQVPTWRTPGGKLWRPNTYVSLFAPKSMVYRESKFLIRDVTLSRKADQSLATLGLVLPGAFSNELPDSLPWIE